MSKIVAFESVTLDGVMQAPGAPRRGSPRRVRARRMGGSVRRRGGDAGRVGRDGQPGAVLLGRVTYEQFATVWPNQPDNPFGAFLNATRKLVASRTLEEPLPWANFGASRRRRDDAVGRLHDEPGQDIVILGSGELVRSLLPHGLIDQLVLQIHPLVLGSGRRLFADDGDLAKFRLADATPTSTGVIVATYERA